MEWLVYATLWTAQMSAPFSEAEALKGQFGARIIATLNCARRALRLGLSARAGRPLRLSPHAALTTPMRVPRYRAFVRSLRRRPAPVRARAAAPARRRSG